MKDGFALNGGTLWGNADPAAYDRLIKFMLDTKQIDTSITANSLMVDIPGYFDKVGQFDVAAVQAAAASCAS